MVAALETLFDFFSPAISPRKFFMTMAVRPVDTLTFEQIKDDPKLRKRLEQFYKNSANDPDFYETTIYSMKMGLRNLD